jgi:hypothetical protein
MGEGDYVPGGGGRAAGVSAAASAGSEAGVLGHGSEKKEV